MIKLKYFTEAEFQRCDPPCSMGDMDGNLLYLLDKIRETAGIPLYLSSAYRSKAYDKAKGRSGNGAHTKGYAVDFRIQGSADRFKIVAAALKCGVERIGIGKTFVHIDTDPSLPSPVMFDYYE